MTCHICGDGPANGVTVYRQNPKGEKGIWACLMHNTQPIEAEVAEIVTVVERDNRDKKRRSA